MKNKNIIFVVLFMISFVFGLVFAFGVSFFDKTVVEAVETGSAENIELEKVSLIAKEDTSVKCVSVSEFYDFMSEIKTFEGVDVEVEGYFTKMEDDRMYYFIADEMCLGCSGTDSVNHFIEVFNVNEIDLTDIWTDDFVRVSGYITMTEDNEFTYPIFCMTDIEMIQETIRG